MKNLVAGTAEVRGRVVRKATLALAIVIVSCAAHTALADTVVDHLDNWSIVAGRTSNLVLDTTNTQAFSGDGSRVKCMDGTRDGRITYEFDRIGSFSVPIYFQERYSAVDVTASPDGNEWTTVRTKFTAPSHTDGEWYATLMQPEGELPRRTRYLSFTIHASPFDWTPQIGEVDLIYNVEPPVTPAGLSVIAASRQSYLTWYPSPGAVTYEIERKAAVDPEFKTVATVKTTDYTDLGLKTGAKYIYAVVADNGMTMSDNSKEVAATVASGTTIFTDDLGDWNSTADHSQGLQLAQCPGGVGCARRNTTAKQTITYALPGESAFAMNVLTGDADAGKTVSAETSTDGAKWTALDLKCDQPALIAPSQYESVCGPTAPTLPPLSNFLRITLAGDTAQTTNPQVCWIRMTYGATTAAHH